jgi:DNA-binding NtrC family response regulator
MAAKRVLVVDDEANARIALAEILRDEGFSVETAADGFKALPKITEFAPAVVLTDLKMPGMDGLEFMERVRALDPEIVVIVMTAFGAVDTAVRAMKGGATDYLTKPIDADQLLVVLDKALERSDLRRERQQLRQRLEERFNCSNIVGHSPELQRVLKTVQQIAPSRATVSITGESGTGKELIAAAIHQHSPRSAGPFVKLHCASLAESLLESELFGHERGAFTGAERRREGRFEQATGGTLFLDEIGEISPAVQVKLLRVLQEREFERVGSNQTVHTDVRVVTATNRDLKAMVADGKFREDLYYRLNVVTLHMPSLRERRSDIPVLAAHFMQKFATENAKSVTQLSDAALETLSRYNWPGNVRELENVIERAVVLASGDTIDVNHLPAELAPAQRDAAMPRIPGSSLEELERYAILRTLEAERGSTSRAAEVLKISVRKIQYKLQEYNSAR